MNISKDNRKKTHSRFFIDLDKESEDAQDVKVQSSKVELNGQYL